MCASLRTVVVCLVLCMVSSETRAQGFSDGLISQDCMRCICTQASDCRPLPCRGYEQYEYCGYFQLIYDYWLDCGRPGTSWQICADSVHCSSFCVQQYIKRYIPKYGCSKTCENYVRTHFGGPRGCINQSTLPFWTKTQKQPGCSNVTSDVTSDEKADVKADVNTDVNTDGNVAGQTTFLKWLVRDSKRPPSQTKTQNN